MPGRQARNGHVASLKALNGRTCRLGHASRSTSPGTDPGRWWSADLAEQGGHVRADPFLGDESVGDAVELVAHVLDGAPGRSEAEELAGMGTAEPHPDGHLV